MTNLKIYVKKDDLYEERLINYEDNIDKKFFQSLILLVDEQLNITREHIRSFFPTGNVNLKKLYHHDWETNQKLKKLSIIRKTNLIAKDKIKEIIQDIDYIICECGARMYRKPLNTPYAKFGKGYLLTADWFGVKYIYSCEDCIRCIDEEIYGIVQNNIKKRKQLLKEGYNWVPNKFGVWYWEGEGNRKHPDSV